MRADCGHRPTLVDAFEPAPGAAALHDMLALDADGTGWRNRQCVLNIAGQVLGGTLAAHCLMAAAISDMGMLPNALHILFVGAADPQRHYRLDTDALRTGRRLAHRQVRLTQDGKVIVAASGMLRADHAESASGAFQFRPVMPAVPPPEDMAPRETGGADDDLLTIQMVKSYPYLEIRGPRGYRPGMNPLGEGRAFYWLRIADSAALDPIDHYALLTMASDFWYTLPLHGLNSGPRPTFITTSLDHAIWFHGRPDLSQWMLVETQGMLIENDIGLNRAVFWSRDGQPIATVTQQALIRGTAKS